MTRTTSSHQRTGPRCRVTLSAVRVIVGIATLLVASVAAAQPVTVTSQNGRKQVSAVRTDGPMSIDGVLDETVWSQAPPAVDFIQADPFEGQPATEITQVRTAFDDQNLYIGALCRDSQPAGIVVNDIRKDFADREQDTFEVQERAMDCASTRVFPEGCRA